MLTNSSAVNVIRFASSPLKLSTTLTTMPTMLESSIVHLPKKETPVQRWRESTVQAVAIGPKKWRPIWETVTSARKNGSKNWLSLWRDTRPKNDNLFDVFVLPLLLFCLNNYAYQSRYLFDKWCCRNGHFGSCFVGWRTQWSQQRWLVWPWLQS